MSATTPAISLACVGNNSGLRQPQLQQYHWPVSEKILACVGHNTCLHWPYHWPISATQLPQPAFPDSQGPRNLTSSTSSGNGSSWHTVVPLCASSTFASPSFIIPKADPTALPRWVCDYRQLNANTIPDNFTLPRIDDTLADCAKGKIWATIDMTDSFFQTCMHPDDIHKTAITTPFGNYEWCVMPMDSGIPLPSTIVNLSM